MIPPADHLLPPNASAAEQRLAAIAARITAIPTPIAGVQDPAAAPAAFLPFLAWERSADFWRADWPAEQKRAVTGEAIALHRIKGTRRAIARGLEHAGARLLQARTPPGKCFASPTWTRADREAWLATLPQLRLYDLAQRGMRGRLIFAGSPHFKSFSSGRYGMRSSARFRLGRHATLTLDGATRAVDVDQSDRVRIRGTSARGAFADAARRSFLVPSDAPARVIALALVASSEHSMRFPVRPGLTVRSVVPERVFARGTARYSAFTVSPARGRYLVPSSAPLRVFARIAIFDAARTPPARRSLAFAGRDRLGIPAHTAELQVSIPGMLPARAALRHLHGHLAAADRRRWRDAFAALRSVQRLSDRLKLDATTYRPIRLGTPVLMGGSYPLGRWTRS